MSNYSELFMGQHPAPDILYDGKNKTRLVEGATYTRLDVTLGDVLGWKDFRRGETIEDALYYNALAVTREHGDDTQYRIRDARYECDGNVIRVYLMRR